MAIPAARRARRAADDAIIMTFINTQRSASKYIIMACRANVNFLMGTLEVNIFS